MTDRKLLEDVRDALTFAELQLVNCIPLGGVNYGALPAVRTTLARVEAALAETSEERVERVARAICKATYYDVEPDMYESEEAFFTKDGPDAWKHFGDSDFMHQARAAIAAMGE